MRGFFARRLLAGAIVISLLASGPLAAAPDTPRLVSEIAGELPALSGDGSWEPVATHGAPSPRAFQSAVWTGTEMVVWGGTNGASADFDDGARYDPAEDRWRPISASGAPSPRVAYASAWTGREMLVWGGRAHSRELGDGGRYDPSADSWSPMGESPLGPRTQYASVWTGSELIVWGGQFIERSPLGYPNDKTIRFDDGARYSPALDAWSPTNMAGAPSPRVRPLAVWTGTEMIVFGGDGVRDGVGETLDDGARYNPTTDTWTPIAAGGPPANSDGDAAVWTGDEMLVVGEVAAGAWSRYDPSTDSWSELASEGGPVGRLEATAVWTGTEMLIWGGSSAGASELRGRAVPLGVGGFAYKPSTNSWRQLPDGPDAPSLRVGHSAVWAGNQMIIWGGWGPVPSASPVYHSDGARYLPPN